LSIPPRKVMRVGDRATVTARITREDFADVNEASDEIFEGLPSENAATQAERLEVGNVYACQP